MQIAITRRLTVKLEKEYNKKLKKEKRLIVTKILELYTELKNI